MRTTIDLPDDLYRRAKAAAALKGVSLKSLITSMLEKELLLEEHKEEAFRVSLPLVSSKRPGSKKLSAEKLNELLEKEDLDVPT